MSNDMFAQKAKSRKGMIKKLFGRISGNSRMETKGRIDQVSGDVGQAADKAKNAFKP
ncbi:CsbD family protein [Nocardia sp. NPDC088792]|uniref:CsbD family protein n=1 Tax=Nocardia sp. NPDC088792 TaxID=3364332 RepID=UPI003812924F